MLLATLRRDWQKVHPGGGVWIYDDGALVDGGRQTGSYGVTYSDGGKVYVYKYRSVYALAERLGMIPGADLNYWVEAQRAIDAMRAGQSYRSLGCLHDTIRTILAGAGRVVCGANERDEYDRTIYVFERIEPL